MYVYYVISWTPDCLKQSKGFTHVVYYDKGQLWFILLYFNVHHQNIYEIRSTNQIKYIYIKKLIKTSRIFPLQLPKE